MSETVGGVLATLVEMGFPEKKAKKALTKTGWAGVERAMEWILANEDDDGEPSEEEEVNLSGLKEPDSFIHEIL